MRTWIIKGLTILSLSIALLACNKEEESDSLFDEAFISTISTDGIKETESPSIYYLFTNLKGETFYETGVATPSEYDIPNFPGEVEERFHFTRILVNTDSSGNSFQLDTYLNLTWGAIGQSVNFKRPNERTNIQLTVSNIPNNTVTRASFSSFIGGSSVNGAFINDPIEFEIYSARRIEMFSGLLSLQTNQGSLFQFFEDIPFSTNINLVASNLQPEIGSENITFSQIVSGSASLKIHAEKNYSSDEISVFFDNLENQNSVNIDMFDPYETGYYELSISVERDEASDFFFNLQGTELVNEIVIPDTKFSWSGDKMSNFSSTMSGSDDVDGVGTWFWGKGGAWLFTSENALEVVPQIEIPDRIVELYPEISELDLQFRRIRSRDYSTAENYGDYTDLVLRRKGEYIQDNAHVYKSIIYGVDP